jgi:hypothetical protein
MSGYDINNLFQTGNLTIIKELYKNGSLSKEKLKSTNNIYFYFSCKYGHLELCKWIHQICNLTKKEVIYDDNIFLCACKYGQLKVCEWLYETFILSKKDITVDYNIVLAWVVKNKHYDIIDFLFNKVGLTKDEVQNRLNLFSEEDKETIMKYLNPLGLFTKSALA